MQTKRKCRITVSGKTDIVEPHEKVLRLDVMDVSFGIGVPVAMDKEETKELINLLTDKYKELWPE